MMNSSIRVRFAPSPTGYLHIGGARTALFNWLYAKSQGGKFILRIEDTDRERSKDEYLQEILESMKWLGLQWDEFYKQSDRFAIYKEQAEKLVEKDLAYYDGTAVMLRVQQQEVKFFDLIRGEIKFDTTSTFAETTTTIRVGQGLEYAHSTDKEGKPFIKDLPLLKSDGSPTYNFACVVDDAGMEISHIIRGEDHISNTPKQIIIYQALGLKIPKFAHLPLILDPEGGRMSKRAGAVAVTDYKKQGFLPEAIVNYLMLLGWSPGNQEVCKIETAIKNFSIKKVNKAGAAFSMEKLKWINSEYIKQKPDAQLLELLIPFIKEKGYENLDRAWLEKVIRLYKSRMATLQEFLERTEYLFKDKLEISPELIAAHRIKEHLKDFQQLVQRLRSVDVFNATNAEQAFRSLVDETGIKSGELVHPVRVVLTGTDVGPSLFETMELLGKDKTVARLSKAH